MLLLVMMTAAVTPDTLRPFSRRPLQPALAVLGYRRQGDIKKGYL